MSLLVDFRAWRYSSYSALLARGTTRLARDEVLAWYGARTPFTQVHAAALEHPIWDSPYFPETPYPWHHLTGPWAPVRWCCLPEVRMPSYLDLDPSEILPLSLEHTFWTWSAQGKVEPIPVTRAKGVYFWDADGKRYLDFNSMTMCVNIGHGDERVIEAIVEQARQLPYAGPPHGHHAARRAGQAAGEITPGDLDHFLFTLGGADANENAIKLARAYTGRHKILARYRSYHGATAGAMAAHRRPAPRGLGAAHHAGRGALPRPLPLPLHLPPRAAPTSAKRTSARDYLNHLEEIIQYEGAETIAAVLLETVTGTNGVIIPPDGYLQGVRALCDRYGILLIADEVMSGFGRTGKWFAVEHWDVVPDLMTMAKGLTSGLRPAGRGGHEAGRSPTFVQGSRLPGRPDLQRPPDLAGGRHRQHPGHAGRPPGRARRRDGPGAAPPAASSWASSTPASATCARIGLFGVLELVRRPRNPRAPGALQRQQPGDGRLAPASARAGLYRLHPLAHRRWSSLR